MELSYRRPQIQDIGQLVEIYRYAIRGTNATLNVEEARDNFKSFIPGDHLSRMLVVEVGNELVGYAGIRMCSQWKAHSQLAELMISVHPAWQRRGIGSALLDEVHQKTLFDDQHTLLIFISEKQNHLHQVLEKMGYFYNGEMSELALKLIRCHSLAVYQQETSKFPVLPSAEQNNPNISIARLIDSHRPDLSYYHDLYRTIHQDPDLGRQEYETARRVADCLRRLPEVQIKSAIGGHGLVGILRNGSGPTVMLRAELDALPVLEQTGWDFASMKKMKDLEDGIIKPVMHACGHDLHMTALLLATETLYACRNYWQGTLIALFQPDEETGRGAQEMVSDGLYDPLKHDVPRPDIVLGGHSMPLRGGRVSTRIGVFNSATDCLRVTLYGRGGHSARPHTTVDPVVLASSIVMKLQTIVSRQTNPLESVVVGVGSIHAGQRANIISDQAVLEISVRALSEDSRSRVLSSIIRMIRTECAALESPKEPYFETTSSFPLLENDPGLTRNVSKALRNHFQDAFDCDAAVSMGAEDMANLARPVNARCCFWTFGCIDPELWDAATADGSISESIHGDYCPSC